MRKNVLIFGSSGFIGTNVSEILAKDYNVTTSSLRDLDNLNKIFSADVILNLVGKAHDHRGEAQENDFYYANYELVKLIFEYFERSNAKLLIHVSSIAALEENGRDDILTEDMECNPTSWYGKSKREAELFLMERKNSCNKKIIILRPTMVHGPGDKGNLTLLYKMIQKGIPYPLAAFDNKRSFLCIDNFSYVIKEMIGKVENIESGIYHLCDDEAISTLQIIDLIEQTNNKKVNKIFLPKLFVKLLAKIGDLLPLPLNSKRLTKLTSNLMVSNNKIKESLKIQTFPTTANTGMLETLEKLKK